MEGALKKYLAEFIGTATLVLVGCGVVVFCGYGAGGAAGILVMIDDLRPREPTPC